MELPHIGHKRIPPGQPRNRINTAAAPFEVLTVTAAPFPGIGKIKYRLHIPLPQLGHQLSSSRHKRSRSQLGPSVASKAPYQKFAPMK